MSVQALKERVQEAEAERDYYQSLVEAFFSGDGKAGGSLTHAVMATWGRKRLETLKATPALYQPK